MVRWSSVDLLLVLVVFQSSQQVDKHGSEESVVIVPLLQINNRKNKQLKVKTPRVCVQVRVLQYQVLVHVHVLWFDEA